MNDSKLLIGSLSNELFRVANFAQKGSAGAANRFLIEAKRWSTPLQTYPIKNYILISPKTSQIPQIKIISLEDAEKYLMYDILLQNYALHTE